MIKEVPKPSKEVWDTYKLIQTLFDYEIECRDLGRIEAQIVSNTDSATLNMLKSERYHVSQNVRALGDQMAEIMLINK